jgi:DNA-binding SARP family transcriptional activator/pimeloyl-ACP methyl ester carboxylesterase/predicted ATPase
VEFRLLGPIEVSDGETILPLAGGKQRALLADLLLHANRTVAVERLVDDLWGADAPDTAVKAVQIYVSRLRKLLPPDRLVTRPPGYLIEVGDGELDLARFQHLLADGRQALTTGDAEQAASLLHQALALWRGPALVEFGEPFGPPEAARLEELRLTCLEERIQADLALGRHADLVGELEALLARDPLRERLRGQHMLALYRCGRQADALAAYQQGRQLLDELGLEPSPALRDLERKILQHDPSLELVVQQPVETARSEPSVTEEPSAGTFVGRDGELGRLRRFLSEATAGHRQVIFVSGEAGIGKTTLVEAFLAHAQAGGPGLLVGRGQCVEQHGAGEPYMPVLEALGAIRDEPDRERLAAVLVEHAPTWVLQIPWLVEPSSLDSIQARALGANRDRMLRELGEGLEALAAAHPVVLVLEDLHWSDHSTVELLGALARRRTPTRLLVLGTYRPADARQRANPIQTVARELALRDLCAELPLPALDEAAATAYVEARLPGAELAPDTCAALLSRTRGSPLFLEKVIDSWVERGLAVAEGDAWRVAGDPEQLTGDLPDTVLQLVDQELLRLPTEDQPILEAASALGAEFSAALVAAAVGLSEETVEQRCHELARAGACLIERGEEHWPDGTVAGKYAFSHDVFREVLYERLPAGRRARLHRALGARLADAYGDRSREIAAELAGHFVRAGDPEQAVLHLTAAAEQAIGRRAPREAIEHLATGLTMLDGVPEGPARAEAELTLRAMLGPALIATEGWSSPEAEAALIRARELAKQVGGREQLASSLFMLATLYETRGEYERSEELLEETLALGTHGGLIADSYELLACSLFHQGVFESALEHAERGLAILDPGYANPLTATYGDNSGVSCHAWAALSLWFLGFPDRARERAAQAVDMAEDPRRRHGYATALVQAALVSQLRLDSTETARWAEAAIEAAEHDGFVYRRAMASILHGWARATNGSGPPDDGIRELREGLDLSRATGARMDDSYYLGLLADACLRAGRHPEALAALGAALEGVPRGGRFFYEAELHRLRGQALLATGAAREEADTALRRALGVARSQGSPSLELRAAVSLVERLSEPERSEQARALVAPVHARFAEGFDTSDLARARSLLGELAQPAQPPAASRRSGVGAVAPALRPPVRYTKSAELNIAYQITGHGPVDLVLVPGFVSHLEKDWEEPRHARFLERLTSFSRLIRFDKRGTGLSDRPAGVPDLEARMDDVRAVMDAAGSEQAILFGYSEGGPMSVLFAAAHPERVLALVLYGAFAKRVDPDEDYPWAPTREARQAYVEQIEDEWGFESRMRFMCPSADEAMARWWGERSRAAASPGAVKALVEMNSQIDVRAILPTIHVPTLVVHRRSDVDVSIEEGRYLAERIPGARLVELAGVDHFVAIDPDQILDAVEPFVAELAGFVPSVVDSRVLATLLVTDIVGSTGIATRLGDRAWADLLASHHAAVREELARFSGEELDTAGDGVCALFDGPARAIRCGLSVRDRLAALGLSVRVGLHTGEIERRGPGASGIALHVAARVAEEAAPGEVLVTATTRDIVAGSGLAFEDRGERLLKGLEEPRRVFAARDGDQAPP